MEELSRLRQGADALGTKRLLDLAAFFNDRHFLKIGTIRAVGIPLGEGHFISEGCGLTTMSALCHFFTSFLAV